MPSKQEKRANKHEQKMLQQHEQNKLNEEEMEWEKGTNKRALKKEQQQEKQLEKMNKAKEVKEMYEKEQEELGPGKKSKSKKDKKDDFSLLQVALASVPKTKSQKLQEEKERQKQLHIKKNEQIKKEKQEKQIEKEKEEKMLISKNIVSNETFDNVEESQIHTIDDALNQLNDDESIKNTFQLFYNKQIAILKEENPKLRLHQYKEHIFKLWKRSPENPANQK